MLSEIELEAMRVTQQIHMMDECVHMLYSAGMDDYNNPSTTYTDGDTLVCGIKNAKHGEGMDKSQVPLVDLVMRLSATASVSHLDRFRITKRFGEGLTSPQTYEIVGFPQRGPSGLLIQLRRVTDGS